MRAGRSRVPSAEINPPPRQRIARRDTRSDSMDGLGTRDVVDLTLDEYNEDARDDINTHSARAHQLKTTTQTRDASAPARAMKQPAQQASATAMATQDGKARPTARVAPPAKNVPQTNKRGAETISAENANKKRRTDAQSDDARASTATTTDLPSVHPDILRVLKHDVKPTDADVRWLQQLGHVSALTAFEREACFAGLLAALEKALELSSSMDVERTLDRVRAAHVASILLEAYAALWASPTDYELHVCAGMLRESESNYSFAVRHARIDMEFRSFEDARTYVRTLGLKSKEDWEAWSKSGDRPHDIPSAPNRTYKESGWISYPDFLGYNVGKVSGEYRSFEDARVYVRTLGMKSQKEWKAWSLSGARPHDIPGKPEATYKSSGWTSLGDFLGYNDGNVAGEYRSFEDAREYARTLGLKSRDAWREWIKSGACPHDIPSAPDKMYKSSGWISYGDFLGCKMRKQAEKPKESKFRSFEDACAYVRTLGLKSQKEWETWRKSGARPHDIPSHPNDAYKTSGWLSYGDFLGYADGKGARGSFRSFEDARAFVHTLSLKNREGWNSWSASGARPPDIPSHPETAYKKSGWTSYPDFLGYAEGKVAGSYRSFEDARTYVHTLSLKSYRKWREWSASGARTHDIPANPDKAYKSIGWTSYGDFLGYSIGNVAGSYRSFEDAREYVRTLGLKGAREWETWSASGARPHDIPSTPQTTYKSSGWTSYGDFLGYAIGKVAGSYRSFEDARAYVRTLGVNSREEWRAWIKSGDRPYDIPANPEQTYKESGWTSLGDFLGYDMGKVAKTLKRKVRA
ncbi:methyltransferase domain-containing protein [Pycnococcus provasolii]